MKFKHATLFAAVILASNAQAATVHHARVMKDEPVMTAVQRPMLFATAEGAYTWTSIGSTQVNGVTASKSTNGWGGRIAGGATHYSSYDQNLSYTAELGWGYYGKTDISLAGSGINAENQIYGLDMLVGANYRYSMIDMFLKVGGMVENIRMSRNTDLQRYVAGGNVVGTSNSTMTTTSVVPEIKVGGVYNINDQWGVSLAYMYVFGNDNVNMSSSKSFNGATITNNSSVTGSPVALSTVMFGLRYSFD